jgi:hypothetical protein
MKTKFLTAAFALMISGTMVFAQIDTTKKVLPVPQKEMQKDVVYYTCTMHHDVKMDKPGVCPTCGLALVEKSTTKMDETKIIKSDAIKTYTCTMHPDVKSDKPGKCPTCGKDLVEKK